MAGIDIVHVPYKGTTQLLPDLIDGRVSMALDSMPAAGLSRVVSHTDCRLIANSHTTGAQHLHRTFRRFRLG
jgi:tripartite-type tricarboxylate transporter receptor subunit TctC